MCDTSSTCGTREAHMFNVSHTLTTYYTWSTEIAISRKGQDRVDICKWIDDVDNKSAAPI